MSMQHTFSRYRAKIFVLCVLLLVAVGLWQQQAIHDWLRLRNYTPAAAVVVLADQTDLSKSARRLFYINHPALYNRQSFGSACSSRGEHTIVLGCYHPVDRGIYIFHVTDPRLFGVDQVTAAHEMLHAAYDRLSMREKSRVDALLQQYYKSGTVDPRIMTIIAAYQKSEPDDVVNEMHSIFGTEVATLPPELETYYAQYFGDRSKVVAYARSYQMEFTSRQNQVSAYDSRLAELRRQIDTNTAQLDAQESEIAELRKQLERDRASGEVEAYNSRVPIYNNRIDSYNALISTTKDAIATYNDLVNTRNQLALQVSELAKAIDSSKQPISQ